MTVPGLRSVSWVDDARRRCWASRWWPRSPVAARPAQALARRHTDSGSHTAHAPKSPVGPAHLGARPVATLPAPVQAPATTAVGGRAILIGGLDQADVSVPDVIAASAAGAERIATLPVARHDGRGGHTRPGHAYVIGGGEPSFDQIDSVGDGGVAAAGALPAAASDVAAATVGSVVYVVGGYTGTAPLDTIVAWTGSGTGRVVAHLPQAASVRSRRGRRRPADHRGRHKWDHRQQRRVLVRPARRPGHPNRAASQSARARGCGEAGRGRVRARRARSARRDPDRCDPRDRSAQWARDPGREAASRRCRTRARARSGARSSSRAGASRAARSATASTPWPAAR